MKELLPIPLYLPRLHEEVNKQRHDLDDLDNLWYIKWTPARQRMEHFFLFLSRTTTEKKNNNNGVIIFFN